MFLFFVNWLQWLATATPVQSCIVTLSTYLPYITRDCCTLTPVGRCKQQLENISPFLALELFKKNNYCELHTVAPMLSLDRPSAHCCVWLG